MADFEERQDVAVEQPQEQGNDIKAIVKDLFEKGAEKDEIIVALNKMKEEGKISDEEVKIGVDYLEQIESEEKAEAEKLFGLQFKERE